MSITLLRRPDNAVMAWPAICDPEPPVWHVTLGEELRQLMDPRTSSEYVGPHWVEQARAGQRRRFGNNRVDHCTRPGVNPSEHTQTLSDHTAACCRAVGR